MLLNAGKYCVPLPPPDLLPCHVDKYPQDNVDASQKDWQQRPEYQGGKADVPLERAALEERRQHEAEQNSAATYRENVGNLQWDE